MKSNNTISMCGEGLTERKCKTRRGSSRTPVKKKLAFGSLSSHAVHAKTSASKDDAPFLSICDDDEGLPDCFELKDVIKKISGEADVIKARERSHKEECERLRVKCKAAAEFYQNLTVLALQEKISSLADDVKEHKGNLDRMMLVSQKWAGYQVNISTLESKVNSLEADKARLEVFEASLHREVEELKQD
nr:hypothetical protein [Tanacetum cinerariifolium]